jgi:hypothetical protein
MGKKQWSAAKTFWQQLLKLSQDNEQQQYVQAKLAATLVYNGDVAEIFARTARSPICVFAPEC